MATEPTLSEVIRDAIESRLVDVHTMKVGKVMRYDADRQVADVQPVVARAYNIGGGNSDYEELPVIPNVPVIWLRGGGFFVHMPLKAGDFVALGFTDDNIAEWRASGELSAPDDLKRHALGSALAFPGCAPALGILSINPLDVLMRAAGMCFGEDGTDNQVGFADDGITVGRRNPIAKRVSPVALADRADARLAALEAQVTTLTAALAALTSSVAASVSTISSALSTHTHTGVTTGAGVSGVISPLPFGPPSAPPDAPAPFIANPLTTAADILKGTGPIL